MFFPTASQTDNQTRMKQAKLAILMMDQHFLQVDFYWFLVEHSGFGRNWWPQIKFYWLFFFSIQTL